MTIVPLANNSGLIKIKVKPSAEFVLNVFEFYTRANAQTVAIKTGIVC